MSFGVDKLLPVDCLNINKFWAIQELLPKFHNFGGEYQFAFKFSCLTYFII